MLEKELHTKIVPGTEIMADVGSHHFVKSSTTSDRVLVPQPSNNPHDPLVSRTKLSSQGLSKWTKGTGLAKSNKDSVRYRDSY